MTEILRHPVHRPIRDTFVCVFVYKGCSTIRQTRWLQRPTNARTCHAKRLCVSQGLCITESHVYTTISSRNDLAYMSGRIIKLYRIWIPTIESAQRLNDLRMRTEIRHPREKFEIAMMSRVRLAYSMTRSIMRYANDESASKECGRVNSR